MRDLGGWGLNEEVNDVMGSPALKKVGFGSYRVVHLRGKHDRPRRNPGWYPCVNITDTTLGMLERERSKEDQKRVDQISIIRSKVH